MLLVETSDQSGLRFFCQSCPYVAKVRKHGVERQRPLSCPAVALKPTNPLCTCTCGCAQVYNESGEMLKLKPKKIDPVIGAHEWKQNAEQTQATCPSCRHDRAFFIIIQLRSADEPSTKMMKCAKCDARWNEE